MAANAASGGRIAAQLRQLLSVDEKQLAEETVSLPVQVYASDLAGINERCLVLANERGLIIYDRTAAEIAAALDLQELDCNYFHAQTIATRIFLADDTLYLFNESTEDAAGSSLPGLVYLYDLSVLDTENSQILNADSTIDESLALSIITDEAAIAEINSMWKSYAESTIRDTAEWFSDAEFMSDEAEREQGVTFSKNSLLWADSSGKNMLSCLTVDSEFNYVLYTRQPDGEVTGETLNLTVSEEDSGTAAAEDQNILPAFVYSGDNEIAATVCTYMCDNEYNSLYADDPHYVYLPAPVIYDTVEKDGDLMVFCNLYGYYYYRNGSTLMCEGGGEAPARLRLHPNADTACGYEVVEDLRTGDGASYEEGIQEFCEGYPGMAENYFKNCTQWQYERSETLKTYTRELIRAELIKMYVRDNGLDIRYYQDYGWDPVSIE